MGNYKQNKQRALDKLNTRIKHGGSALLALASGSGDESSLSDNEDTEASLSFSLNDTPTVHAKSDNPLLCKPSAPLQRKLSLPPLKTGLFLSSGTQQVPWSSHISRNNTANCLRLIPVSGKDTVTISTMRNYKESLQAASTCILDEPEQDDPESQQSLKEDLPFHDHFSEPRILRKGCLSKEPSKEWASMHQMFGSKSTGQKTPWRGSSNLYVTSKAPPGKGQSKQRVSSEGSTCQYMTRKVSPSQAVPTKGVSSQGLSSTSYMSCSEGTSSRTSLNQDPGSSCQSILPMAQSSEDVYARRSSMQNTPAEDLPELNAQSGRGLPSEESVAPTSKESEATPSRKSEFTTSRESEAPTSRDSEATPSRESKVTLSRQYEDPTSREFEVPPSRESEVPPSRESEAATSREIEFIPSKVSEINLSKEASHSTYLKGLPTSHVSSKDILEEISLFNGTFDRVAFSKGSFHRTEPSAKPCSQCLPSMGPSSQVMPMPWSSDQSMPLKGLCNQYRSSKGLTIGCQTSADFLLFQCKEVLPCAAAQPDVTFKHKMFLANKLLRTYSTLRSMDNLGPKRHPL